MMCDWIRIRRIDIASNSVKKYFDIIKNDDLSILYHEIYRKIITQDGFLVERIIRNIIFVYIHV